MCSTQSLQPGAQELDSIFRKVFPVKLHTLDGVFPMANPHDFSIISAGCCNFHPGSESLSITREWYRAAWT